MDTGNEMIEVLGNKKNICLLWIDPTKRKKKICKWEEEKCIRSRKRGSLLWGIDFAIAGIRTQICYLKQTTIDRRLAVNPREDMK